MRVCGPWRGSFLDVLRGRFGSHFATQLRPLLLPPHRPRPHQPAERQPVRLFATDDALHDVRRQAGQPTASAVEQFNDAMRVLLEERLKAETQNKEGGQ